jgi:hypothetical protein
VLQRLLLQRGENVGQLLLPLLIHAPAKIS